MDVGLAAFLVLFTIPVIIPTIVALIFVNRGNPFFFQDRPGFNEKIFTLVKFKTMRDIFDDQGNLLPDNQRMTKLGVFVRKSSIDELPQLWNVLKGDMSIVGPRPLLVEYLPLYNQNQKRRHLVKPGITGWAQVNGRNSISWDEKFGLDGWYVENLSFALDFKILANTVKNVLTRKGINNSDSVPMPKFKGNKIIR